MPGTMAQPVVVLEEVTDESPVQPALAKVVLLGIRLGRHSLNLKPHDLLTSCPR
jgi:hypothetical protein